MTAIPLASTVSAKDGTFELRSALPELSTAFTANGWAHLVVSALTPDGSWSLAVDSVRFVPGPGGQGLWASTASGADQARRLFAGGPVPGLSASAVEERELSDTDQRPQRLVLAPPTADQPAAVPLKGVGPGEPYEACVPLFTEGAPQKGFRTVADIEVYQDWSFKMSYTETDTTAWEVGYEKSSGNWGVAGSLSFDDSRGKGYDTQFGPYSELFQESFQVQLEHVKVVWRCGDHKSPGPFYVRTVEPRSWTGGTYNQGDPSVRCDTHHLMPVAAGTFSYRQKGKSSKYSASGNVFGFNGRASVEYSKTTQLGWMNHQSKPRHVCGESSNPLSGRTRVSALPF